MAKLTLTPQQQSVVEDRGGSLLVSAAAGSGKTKVLVERLFRYVTAEHCNLDDFLIITYTKAAAAELRGKIAEELSKRLAETPGDLHLKRQLLRVYQADIKTVDAFCTALLRENTHLLAREGERYALTPDFKVLDDSEAKLVRQHILDRTLEEFYGRMDAGKELLAGTLGAGRDDRALAELVLELYDKLQSHADPQKWLDVNRMIWAQMDRPFDSTPYAEELLVSVCRKAAHWAALLEQTALRAEGDSDLYGAYGVKFMDVAAAFSTLAASPRWDDAGKRSAAIVFPRMTAPKGRKDDPDVVGMKRVWDACKEEKKKLDALLAVSGEEAMEDLRAMAPAMEALLDLTAAFSESYRQEKLRTNSMDFSDQEHLALQLLVRENGTPTELGEQVAARYQEILVAKDCRCPITKQMNDALVKLIDRYDFVIFDSEFDLKYLNLLVDYPIDTSIIVANPNLRSVHLAGDIYDYSKKYSADGQIGIILNKADKENLNKFVEQINLDNLNLLGIIEDLGDEVDDKKIAQKIKDFYPRLNLPQEGSF